jgi:hypothetical protein
MGDLNRSVDFTLVACMRTVAQAPQDGRCCDGRSVTHVLVQQKIIQAPAALPCLLLRASMSNKQIILAVGMDEIGNRGWPAPIMISSEPAGVLACFLPCLQRTAYRRGLRHAPGASRSRLALGALPWVQQ